MLIFFSVSGEYSPSLDPDSTDLLFIQRLSVRYGVPLPESFYSRPVSHSDVSDFLTRVWANPANASLSKDERSTLVRLSKQIGAEQGDWSYKSDPVQNYLDIGIKAGLNLYPRDSLTYYTKGVLNPGVSGCVGILSYFAEVDVWTEGGSDTLYRGTGYQPYNGPPRNIYGRKDSGSLISSDKIRAGISIDKELFRFETGIDYLSSGPSVENRLTLSGREMPVTYFRSTMRIRNLRYYHTIGKLKSQKDKAKYLYFHRFQFPLFNKRMTIGINEVIVNGSTTDEQDSSSDNALRPAYYGEERDWEWEYMIPFVPYSFAEHYVGDRDNALLSFDFSLSFPSNFRWYAEFLLDDITTPWGIFSDDWGNKWALTAGVNFYGMIGGRSFEAGMEYCRIEPWVYTHFYGGSHRYSHFGRSLGSDNGPDSDEFVCYLRYALTSNLYAGLKGSVFRKGRQRGSSIRHVFQGDTDKMTKEFLGDDYYQRERLNISFEYYPVNILNIRLDCMYETGRGLGAGAYTELSF
ncbi:MAG: hypothetical protein ACOCSE_00870 [Chitinivibrionales bacterium]